MKRVIISGEEWKIIEVYVNGDIEEKIDKMAKRKK